MLKAFSLLTSEKRKKTPNFNLLLIDTTLLSFNLWNRITMPFTSDQYPNCRKSLRLVQIMVL